MVGWDHHEERKKRKGDDHVFDEGERAMMSDSQKPNLDKKWLYDDLSMVSLQFSYVICFASILPVAPLFALLVISLELKSDLYKYLFLGQRPSPTRASGVGIWLTIWDMVTFVAAPINVLVVFRQGSAWQRHTYLGEMFTNESDCQAIAGAFLMAALMLATKACVKLLVGDTANWVRASELRAKFMKTRGSNRAESPMSASPKRGVNSIVIEVKPKRH